MPATRTVKWSTQAETDLFEVLDHLQREHPASAHDFLAKTQDKLSLAVRFPFSGRPIPEDTGLRASAELERRELIVMTWRVGYAITENSIVVLYVLHGSRQFPPAR